MKKRVAVAVTLLAIFLSTALVFVWMHSDEILENTLDDYEEVMGEGIPSDLKLTIYYMPPDTLTRMPIRTLDELVVCSSIIEVDAEKLAVYADRLAALTAACLKPLEEGEKAEPIIGFLRLAYILERGNGEVLLEVMTADLLYDESILVNGFEVENNPIFYELIDPFLTEEDRSILRWKEDGSLS